MNRNRRVALQDLNDRMSVFVDTLNDIQSELETLRDEEQEYLNAMPEAFQAGEKGEMAQVAIDAMESAISDLTDMAENVSQIEASIEAAAE